MVAVSLKKKNFFQEEDGIRDVERSRGLGDVYKRQDMHIAALNGFTDRYGYAYRGVYDLLDDYYFSKSNNNSEYTEDEIKEKGVITMDFGMLTGV